MDIATLCLDVVLVASGFSLGLGVRRRRAPRVEGHPREDGRLSAQPDAADLLVLPDRTSTAALAPPIYPALLTDLREAQHQDVLHLSFQPKLRARTGTIDSVEALVRWPHADGDIPPDRFIGLAEDHGGIAELTQWVTRRALRDQAAMATAGFDLTVYINVSARLLPDREFAHWLIATLGAGGKIGLEVTETAMITDPQGTLDNLKLFADAGIRIAIDDYGAGFSSLAYLKQVPAQELKLDKMFISGLASSHRDPLLVRSTIDLAHALEMEVTAEGVESPAELALLRMMGCDLMQGFLISHPLQLPQLIDYLRDQRPESSGLTLDAGFSAFGLGRR